MRIDDGFIYSGTQGARRLGYYWSSTIDGSNAKGLVLGPSGTYIEPFTRAIGCSVRCIAEDN